MNEKQYRRRSNFFDPRRHIQNLATEIIVLEAEENEVNSSPVQALKSLALELFEEGKIDRALQFSKAALEINPHVFNHVEIGIISCQGQDELESLLTLIPEAIFVSKNAISNENTLDWAKFYKKEAEYQLKQNRVFSALKLFEMALECDKNILDNESADYLPNELLIFPFPLNQNISNIFKLSLVDLDNEGIDYSEVVLEIPEKITSENSKFKGIIKMALLNFQSEEEYKKYIEDAVTNNYKNYVEMKNSPQPTREARSLMAVLKGIVIGVGVVLLSPFILVGLGVLKIKDMTTEDLNYSPYPLVSIVAALGHVNILQKLISQKDCIRTIDWLGGTPLMWSILFSQKESVKSLFQNGIEIPSIHGSVGHSIDRDIFIYRILAFCPGMLRFLVEEGMNIDELNEKDRTKLMKISKKGTVKEVELLLESGAKVNMQNSQGVTALMIASHHHNLEVMKFLLDHGSDIDIVDKNGDTALAYALKYLEQERKIVSRSRKAINSLFRSTRKKEDSIRASKISAIRLLLSYAPAVLIEPDKLPSESRELIIEMGHEYSIRRMPENLHVASVEKEKYVLCECLNLSLDEEDLESDPIEDPKVVLERQEIKGDSNEISTSSEDQKNGCFIL